MINPISTLSFTSSKKEQSKIRESKLRKIIIISKKVFYFIFDKIFTIGIFKIFFTISQNEYLYYFTCNLSNNSFQIT